MDALRIDPPEGLAFGKWWDAIVRADEEWYLSEDEAVHRWRERSTGKWFTETRLAPVSRESIVWFNDP